MLALDDFRPHVGVNLYVFLDQGRVLLQSECLTVSFHFNEYLSIPSEDVPRVNHFAHIVKKRVVAVGDDGLGLGLQAPTVSWGTLLQDCQTVDSMAATPWLMFPALFIIVSVLCFCFMGDGLRDAADPYK